MDEELVCTICWNEFACSPYAIEEIQVDDDVDNSWFAYYAFCPKCGHTTRVEFVL